MGNEAVERDPVFTQLYLGLGYGYFHAGRLDEAISTFQKAIELSPGSSGSNYYLGCVLLVNGDLDAALAAMEKEVRDGFKFTGRALVYHALGNKAQSDVELNSLIETWTDSGAYQIATVYAYKDEIDKAFDWLDHAIEKRDTGLSLLHGDPFIDNLRDDPRLDAVMERVGL